MYVAIGLLLRTLIGIMEKDAQSSFALEHTLLKSNVFKNQGESKKFSDSYKNNRSCI